MLQIILFSVLALGCAQKKIGDDDLPSKPLIDMCFVNVETQGLDCRTAKGAYYSMPFIESDKYIAFSPDHWAIIGKYNIDLRARAKTLCECK